MLYLPTMEPIKIITFGRTIHTDGSETFLPVLVRFQDGTTDRVNPLTLGGFA